MAEEEIKAEETPTLPEETPKEEEKPKTEVDELLAELEKVGITDAAKLQGTIRASKEAGNLANLVGELRSEIAEIKQAKPKPSTSDSDYLEPQDVDLRSLIREELMGVERQKSEMQAKAQKRMLEQYQEIKGDKFYPQVKEIWNEKLKDPEFVFEIQSGSTDPLREYDKMVREYLVGIAQRSAETIKTLQGGKPIAPHVESGSARIPSAPDVKDENKKPKTKAIREKAEKGYLPTEDDQLDAIGEMLAAE